jgi:hypothetical protein
MKSVRFIIFIGVFLLLAAPVFAAPAPPTGTSPSCWPPPCVPIDGGISFLIVAGAAYGAKKLYADRKSKNV